MSLKTARDALAAELQHCRKGLAYYQSKAQVLQEALEQLEHLDTIKPATTRSRKKQTAGTRSPVTNRKRRTQANRTENSKTKRDRAIPVTGEKFWLDLLSDKTARSVEEIRREALNTLARQGFTPDDAQLRKLNARMANALSVLASQRGRVTAEPGPTRRGKLYRLAAVH